MTHAVFQIITTSELVQEINAQGWEHSDRNRFIAKLCFGSIGSDKPNHPSPDVMIRALIEAGVIQHVANINVAYCDNDAHLNEVFHFGNHMPNRHVNKTHPHMTTLSVGNVVIDHHRTAWMIDFNGFYELSSTTRDALLDLVK